MTSVLKWITGLWLAAVAAAMFLWVPAHEGLGNVGRIVIMHVPTGWLTSVAFLVSAIYSALYLRRGRASDDANALAAAELGLIFSVLATLTGAIFAKVVWGTFWNWDPRETAIAVLMLIYAAYFALRSSIEDVTRQRRLSAIYALLAFVTVPFLVFVIPRITDSTLHPNCAILNTPNCEALALTQGGTVIGTVEDFRLELKGVEQRGDLLVATVEVRNPRTGILTTLRPSFNQTTGRAVAIEQVPDTLRELQIKSISGQPGAQTLNLALANVGNVGLLTEQRTLITFFAALAGFTALFVWLWRLRVTVLGINEELTTQGWT
jgi:heme exporter protein C